MMRSVPQAATGPCFSEGLAGLDFFFSLWPLASFAIPFLTARSTRVSVTPFRTAFLTAFSTALAAFFLVFFFAIVFEIPR
jgi:hypothetical protein